MALLLQLSRAKDHVYGPAGRLKTALGLWQDVLCEDEKAVQQNSGEYLTSDA